MLFSRKEGQPFDDVSLSSTFHKAALRWVCPVVALQRQILRWNMCVMESPELVGCSRTSCAAMGLVAVLPAHAANPCSIPLHPQLDRLAYPNLSITTPCRRLTGKRTTPHLVRDMIVTYLRGGNASERELEALAIYMGHSMQVGLLLWKTAVSCYTLLDTRKLRQRVLSHGHTHSHTRDINTCSKQMQRDSYDRRTKSQKVEPAVELLQAVNARAKAIAELS